MCRVARWATLHARDGVALMKNTAGALAVVLLLAAALSGCSDTKAPSATTAGPDTTVSASPETPEPVAVEPGTLLDETQVALLPDDTTAYEMSDGTKVAVVRGVEVHEMVKADLIQRIASSFDMASLMEFANGIEAYDEAAEQFNEAVSNAQRNLGGKTIITIMKGFGALPYDDTEAVLYSVRAGTQYGNAYRSLERAREKAQGLAATHGNAVILEIL